MLIADGRVAWVGPSDEVGHAARTRGLDVTARHACDGRLLTPGLVDCHTHAIVAGDRAGEFALRARGASYLEIAAAGGGIAATTGPTRAATDDELIALTVARLAAARATGTTTMEIKNGYDLTIAGEERLLRLIARAAAASPVQVVPTLLCHVVPAERRADRAAYVVELVRELVPAVRRVGGGAIARGWVVLDSAGLGTMRPGFGPGATQGNVILHELSARHRAGPRRRSSPVALPHPAADRPERLRPGRPGWAAGGRPRRGVPVRAVLGGPRPEVTRVAVATDRCSSGALRCDHHCE